MTDEQVRDEAVRRGVAEVTRVYTAPEQSFKLKGALAGFERVKKIPLNREQWEAEIEKLEKEVRALKTALHGTGQIFADQQGEYIERRYFQLQVEWVFEIMKVHWRIFPQSARAGAAYGNIVQAMQ